MRTQDNQWEKHNRRATMVLSLIAAILIKSAWDRTVPIILGQPPTGELVAFTLCCWILGLAALVLALRKA